jgi:hypothetical protein
MLGQARFVRAGIVRIGHTVSVPVPLRHKRAPLFLRHSYLVRAGIAGIPDAISIAIGATR